MDVLYAGDEAHFDIKKSLFLAGPTPRDQSVESWRPTMLKALEMVGYDGAVFVPEPRSGIFNCHYHDQVEWEKRHLERADLIVFWVPRNLQTMPAFTTNVEFGIYIDSGKLIYGRPSNSVKNRYLDWLYTDRGLGKIHDNMISLARESVERFKKDATGKRGVPLDIWQNDSFQKWYSSQISAGNQLHEAKLLWKYDVRGKPFCWALWAKMWIESEKRYKENEFVLTRSDISTIFAYQKNHNDFMNSEVLMVKEFRVPARTRDGFIHELPGGSSFKPGEDPCEVAVHELFEETGIQVDSSRMQMLKSRQLAGTFSSHHAHLFAVELSEEEMKQGKDSMKNGETKGVVDDSEKTYIEIKTLRELLNSDEVDWSTMGMLFQGLFQNASA